MFTNAKTLTSHVVIMVFLLRSYDDVFSSAFVELDMSKTWL